MTKQKITQENQNTSALKKTKSDATQHTISQATLLVPSNQEAKILFGHFEENLKYIAQELAIEIRSKGNQLTLLGEKQKLLHAQRIFDYLREYINLEGHLYLSDVKSAIHMTNSNAISTVKNSKPPSFSPPGLNDQNADDSKSKIITKKKTIYARTPTQNRYIKALGASSLVFGTGPAGTGKTYLAVAYAAYLLEQGIVERIILSRPAVEAGERLGFLPGDMKEKVDPYLRPLYDALYDMIPGEKVERALASGVIEIAPLAFMRGRSFRYCAVILDEAQNTLPMQMKMFLTRLSEGAHMIITGDPSQVDLPSGQKSGLIEAMRILKDIKDIRFVHFTEKDIVRHPLVAKIVQAYDKVEI